MTAGLAVPERVRIIMAMLSKAADAGEPCPTNDAIAERIGMSGRATGANALALLEAANLILVERSNCRRVVTIVSTGKRTAGTITNRHWRDRVAGQPGNRTYAERKARDAQRRAEMTERPMPSPVFRDPCPRCGVRGDVGCAHSGADLALGMHV